MHARDAPVQAVLICCRAQGYMKWRLTTAADTRSLPMNAVYLSARLTVEQTNWLHPGCENAPPIGPCEPTND